MGYHLTKRVISNYLRSNCKRRLSLDLVPDKGANDDFRNRLDMPPKYVARPGMRIIQDQGDAWEREKLGDLERAFGVASMIAERGNVDGEVSYNPVDMAEVLRAGVNAGQRFIIQGKYSIPLEGEFEIRCNLRELRQAVPLSYGDLIPDIVQLLDVGTATKSILADGSILPVLPDDQRIPLRIIDIKLTAEASNAYFGEVCYYSMTLAGLLADEGLTERYFVSPDAAVWPGSHDASKLSLEVQRLRSLGQDAGDSLWTALELDLETLPFEVFAPRLRRFFRDELREAIQKPWREQTWHVGSQCSGCEYLGYMWLGSTVDPDARHCYPTAQATDNLSRVPFVSRGARLTLESSAIGTVADLAGAGAGHPSLRGHQTLRATKTIVAGRAEAIASNAVVTPPHVGTSALMPRWADLKLYVTADFDIGSGVTGILGLSGFFWDSTTEDPEPIAPQTFVVDTKSLQAEYREVVRFLSAIKSAIDTATAAMPTAKLQVYIWDTATYDHIVRVIGRHLPALVASNGISSLIWLFPPEEVIPNPELSDRKSPICILQSVAKSVVAAPVDHYYSLLRLARVYHRDDLADQFATFNVSNHYEDPFTDQIPSERIHELWARVPNWNRTLDTLSRVVKVKLRALNAVARQLETVLRDDLTQSAPRIIDLKAPTNRRGLAEDSKLWLMFAEWDTALSSLKNEQLKAMPEHEREARFNSAVLMRRLDGEDKIQELARLGVTGTPDTEVYELSPDSVDFKGKENDFTFCLRSSAWQSQKLIDLINAAGLDADAIGCDQQRSPYASVDSALGVTILRLDRDAHRVVLELSDWWSGPVRALRAAGVLNLDGPLMLDPTHRDFFTERVRKVLTAVGAPPEARPAPEVAAALPTSRRGRAPSTSSPLAKVLWTPNDLESALTSIDSGAVIEALRAIPTELNTSQWDAVAHAVSRKLTLIWGPPGTGKSKTIRAILQGLGIAAAGGPLKVLVTGPTYEALDNIMSSSVAFRDSGFEEVMRLTSSSRVLAEIEGARTVALESRDQVRALRQQIEDADVPILLSATAQQAYKLVESSGNAIKEVFDYIIIDEASQMNVGIASLGLCGLKTEGAVIIAGDPLQLPPIHQAVPDESYAYLVSSIYEYLVHRFDCPQKLLNRSYRSNQEIVSIGYFAGYSREFVANEPAKRLHLSVPDDELHNAPGEWPEDVAWSPAYGELLRSDRPIVAYVYGDGMSCQSNRFEAETVLNLVRLARQTVLAKPGADLASEHEFWTEKIGIVTPHRAQQSLVTRLLQSAFPEADRNLIRNAVDTVERFQGQEREIIIATYAVGDEDAIGQEESFLMSLNRFNVTASRAKTKLICLLTQELVDHLASDKTALQQSCLLKSFVELACPSEQSLEIPWSGGTVAGNMRFH